MQSISLLYSTGNTEVDAALEGVVGLFELLFPGRVSGYYLTGSFSDGTAIPGSDIDLSVLFRGPSPSEAETTNVDQAAIYCGKLCPIELDITPMGEDIPWPLRVVSLKLGSRLIYGEDARDRLPLPTIEAYTRHAMDLAYRLISGLHRAEGTVTLLLGYPDPDDEFYGFLAPEDRAADSATPSNTKGLVVATGLAATAILALRAGRYVARKRDAARLYRELINDEWADFIGEIYERCRDAWRYAVPPSEEDRRLLRALCEQVLGFENHFLRIHCEYLLRGHDAPQSGL
jgi:hypothetical protein